MVTDKIFDIKFDIFSISKFKLHSELTATLLLVLKMRLPALLEAVQGYKRMWPWRRYQANVNQLLIFIRSVAELFECPHNPFYGLAVIWGSKRHIASIRCGRGKERQTIEPQKGRVAFSCSLCYHNKSKCVREGQRQRQKHRRSVKEGKNV